MIIPAIDLEIEDGEFVVFVGPVRLRQVHAAAPDRRAGRHHRRHASRSTARDVTDAAPAKRGLAMVFQSYALYPHMSVYNNIAFPLKMAGTSKATHRPEGRRRPPRRST